MPMIQGSSPAWWHFQPGLLPEAVTASGSSPRGRTSACQSGCRWASVQVRGSSRTMLRGNDVAHT